MKVIIEFDEFEDAQIAMRANSYIRVLQDFERKTRDVVKYNNQKSKEEIDVWMEVRSLFFQCLEEEGIDTWRDVP